ncbi:hypothetical protein A2U01_0036976, partial [Trifolium medium]|nr:hypothetical protein [Trifolium medium]
KEAVKVPNHPLLMKKTSGSVPETSAMLFDNESKEVVLEYIRLMKEEGLIVSKSDIAPAPTEDRRGKRVAASGSGKEKVEIVVKEKEKRKIIGISVSDKENVAKKQRTQKKSTRTVRKLLINEDDDEETDEEPLKCKRKRSELEAEEMNAEADAGISQSIENDILNFQAQNQPEYDLDPALLKPLNIAFPPQLSDLPTINSETDLDTIAEGVEIASELHKNKTRELSSLIQEL